MSTHVTSGAIAIGAILLCAGIASAQNYPTKPVRLVTAEPGGGNDFAARLIVQGIAGSLGQPMIVDNRGGAGGLIAAEHRGQGAARRLHAAALRQQYLDHSAAEPQCALRCDPGLRADYVGREIAQRRGGQRGAAGEVRRGPGRARQGPPGRPQLWFGRHGILDPPRGGTLQVHGGCQHRARRHSRATPRR